MAEPAGIDVGYDVHSGSNRPATAWASSPAVRLSSSGALAMATDESSTGSDGLGRSRDRTQLSRPAACQADSERKRSAPGDVSARPGGTVREHEVALLGYGWGMNVPTWVKTGAAVTAAALVGSRAARPGSRWYRSLDKPGWQPPRQIFPVVWTLLYGLLAYAGARAIDSMPPGKRRAFRVSYATNLGLNAGWTAVFFKARKPTAALAEIAALNASNMDLLRRAWTVDRAAGAALVPYLAWTAFATALNADIARRNR